jgi:hypothetical protein
VARKPRKRLTPISQLSPARQRERRTARAAGFRDERSYRRWLERNDRYGEQDYKKLDRSLRGARRIDRIKEIRRAEDRERRLRPAMELLRKYDVLVINDGWSHLAFWQRYRLEIEHIIANTKRNSTDGAAMRRLRRELHAGFLLDDYSDVT